MIDFSIKTDKLKAIRKAKIGVFVSKYGRGDKNLTESQKEARIGKVLGSEVEKLKDFGENKDEGVFLLKEIRENVKGNTDFTKYPDDPYEIQKTGKSKVLNIEIRDDGTLIMEGIHLNGKEHNIKEWSGWAVTSIGDKDAAIAEKKQFERGVLKEVSDRTMAIHEDNGNMNILLESESIDTDEDKEMQY